MLFNSVKFLIFFPVITTLYFLFPHDKRWLLLLIASFIFYMAFIPKYVVVLVVLILIDYFAAILIEKSKGQKRKIFLLVSLFVNVGMLVFFKYFNFLFGSIEGLISIFGIHLSLPYLSVILPLGLSFHVFQSMSYTIEVYRGKFKPERHLGIYALYVMFYPQLVAGPIERPYSLLPQFHQIHKFDTSRVFNGLKLMLWGFFKKIVIADRLAVIVNMVYNSPTSYSGSELLIATYFFAIQILCDFAGYSDIATGAALIMGYDLRQNFNKPYISQSISEFWNRWHMSLSGWFRDYLYIPLGGNRVSKIRWYINIMIVFLVSGLWHGADWKFVLWGALHGGFIIISSVLSKFIKKVNKYLAIFVTFNLASFAWIFFRANNINQGLLIAQKIFSDILLLRISFTSDFLMLHSEYIIITLILILFGEVVLLIQGTRSIRDLLSDKPLIFRWVLYYALILFIIFYGEFNETKFIYFQF